MDWSLNRGKKLLHYNKMINLSINKKKKERTKHVVNIFLLII